MRDSHRVLTRVEPHCGTSVGKESPKVRLPSRVGRRGRAVGVSCSCQQLTGLPSNGLVSGSQGSPAQFRETSTDQKRSSPRSHTYLGTLSHLGVLGTFS